MQKRKMIIDKISDLGNDLSSLALGEISDRNMTFDAKNGTSLSRVQPRNYKTSRQVNRTVLVTNNSRF